MGSLYRSESMALCQLFLQVDSAFESVAQLGELGICQFRDLNSGISPFQRKYVSEVKRCNEMERKIRFLEEEMNRQCVPIPDLRECPPAPPPKDINDLEVNLERLEDEVLKMNKSVEEMRRDYARLSDMQAVLLQLQVFFQEDQRSNAINAIADAGVGPIEVHSPMAGANNAAGFVGSKTRADSMMPIVPRSNELRFLAGIVPTDRALAFERLLWRMCHGKVFFRTQNVRPDPLAPFIDEQKKSAFILFFAGDSFLPKVKRICDSFRATIVDNCPEDAFERAKVLNTVLMRISDMNTVIGKTLEHRQKMLAGAALKLREWDIQVLKLKSIFFELNKFSLDVTQRCLIAECWVPQFGVAQVRRALHAAAEANGSSVPSIVNRLEGDEFHGHGTPPTFHRLNKFTSAFQGIVDAYGVANYREVNPAPWTIITFPFLFALMFGDSGHGLIMLLAALGLILFERRIEAAKIRDEIFNTFYGGRYVIMLMGAFAIYTGLIYNDVFSKSLNLFGSRWGNDFNVSALMIHMEIDEEKALELDPYGAFLHDQGPYIFGLDPVWNLAENRLNFVNPMKMKASVIIGVSQMLFGLLLSLQNHRFFRSKLDTFFVFLPQLLFLSLIFIYLCAQIIAKWLFFWVKSGVVLGQSYPGAQCAPSLLVGLINMFMFKGRQQGFVDADGKTLAQCHLQYWYPKQGQVETTFMTIAMLCIPVMLLVKPLVLLVRSKKGQHVEVHGAEDGVFRFGDVFVYQAIHTIEFALGCISHTASYLRLWALSLAHAQLSEVLWTMVMRFGFTLAGWPGAVASFTIFWAFGILSFAILVLMEGLSAFLHALRLHWVEFQSKFYVGAGIAFEPFSFVKAIRKHEGLDD